MKQGRHETIIELIRRQNISTQEELLDQLRKLGYNITQATVSRDIKQLRLVKALSSEGKYVYAVGKAENNDLSKKFDSLLPESIITIDHVMNQVVIKCYSGLANALCAAMDSMHFQGLVGTLAGDDTILAIMRTEKDASTLCSTLQRKLP